MGQVYKRLTIVCIVSDLSSHPVIIVDLRGLSLLSRKAQDILISIFTENAGLRESDACLGTDSKTPSKTLKFRFFLCGGKIYRRRYEKGQFGLLRKPQGILTHICDIRGCIRGHIYAGKYRDFVLVFCGILF